MSLELHPPGPLGLATLLARRELAARLLSPWFYGVACLICVIAWVYGDSFQRSFAIESVMVTADPLMPLNVLIVILLGIVLGLRLASSLAWEREHRTLEVLIVGPVPFEAVVLSKFAVEIGVMAILIAIYLLYLVAAQPLGAGVIGLNEALAIGRLPLHALPLLALGLFVSAWARSVRGAIVVYLAVVLVLGVFAVTLRTLAGTPPEQLTLAAVYLRGAMQGASTLLDPLSPVARLMDLVAAVSGDVPPSTLQTLAALALAAGLLLIAAIVARRRGALA
jgi:ABC-type transport system involved in multi-copper enzyme maturation permease subunit